MHIETKFDIGEVVFMPFVNEIQTQKVQSIQIVAATTGDINESKVTVYYDLCGHDEHGGLKVEEDSLFKTKKAAVKRVIENMGYRVSEADIKDMED